MVSGHALARRQARCIQKGCATLPLYMQARLVACRAHGKIKFSVCHVWGNGSSGKAGAQVTAPQLTLLENVMARMERVDVWILMNGGGSGVNPFQVRCAALPLSKLLGKARDRVSLASRAAALSQICQSPTQNRLLPVWYVPAHAEAEQSGTQSGKHRSAVSAC